MKASEIVVGGMYTANVNNAVVRVRVDGIEDRPYGAGRAHTAYHVTNTKTGRKTTFRSAAKFRSRVDVEKPVVIEVTPKRGFDGVPVIHKDKPKGLAGVIERQQASKPTNAAPHVIVQARAGTGKTTTLIEGLKRLKGLPTSIEPSPQQLAVWQQMESSKDARSIGFVAFNKAIADELSRRVPAGVESMTMHSLGFRALQKALGRQQPNSYVVLDYICEIMESDVRELRKNKPNVLNATERLVSLCKQNLTDPTPESLEQLSSYYDVDLNGDRSEVFDLVAKIIERCKNPKGQITFDDMIWIPVVLNLPTTRYDLLLVDEAQDLNRCQQSLAKKCGERLILVGDDMQAIYGFAGADSESMSRIAKELSCYDAQIKLAEGMPDDIARSFLKGSILPTRVVILPLTVTRRCGKTIVAEAQRYVPEFTAHESNCDGEIRRMASKGKNFNELMDKAPAATALNPCLLPQDWREIDYSTYATDGDMILCRINAPLVSQCFRFLRMGRKATIRGRDVGQGLVSTVNKLTKGRDACTVVEFTGLLSDWFHKECDKEQAKKFPSATKLESLEDRYECLVCFTEGCETAAQMIRKIESIFTDNKEPGVMFSSIHRSKGLESRRVFLLQAFMGGKRERREWEVQQEMNLTYVAVTRAIEEFVYVSMPERK